MKDIGQTITVGVDLREYYLSMEWDLISAIAFKGQRWVAVSINTKPEILF